MIKQDKIEIAETAKMFLLQKSWWERLLESQIIEVDKEHKYYQQPLTRRCLMVAQSTWFNVLVDIIILGNCIVLAMDKYPDYPERVKNIAQALNMAMTSFFVMETSIKIIAMGLKPFLSLNMN